MGPTRQEGTLTEWNDQRGCGRITCHGEGGQEVLVHASAFTSDGYLPTTGEVLTFDIEPDGEGRPSAVRVERTGAPAAEVAKAPGRGRKLRLSKGPSSHAGSSSSTGRTLIVLVLLAALVVFAYSRYAKRVGQIEAAAHRSVTR